ncbi:MAG: hydantoinase B/oxoprolinase family protein, partial [Gemmatimonadetes bacterium]|nr:hydantoinase B/oxoprolinase family protein [Gemmatimonadota bacterium]
MGAGPGGPGLSGVHVHMTNSLNTPVEALEHAYPLRVRRYEIRRGTGGAGLHRGGDGLRRDLELLADAEVSLLTERRQSRPAGLAGGEPGAAGANVLIRAGEEQPLPAKTTFHARAGDVISIRTPGGGGWGVAAFVALALGIVSAGSAAQSPDCGGQGAPSAAASADLYCIPLLPAPDFPQASGMAEMERVPAPFGMAVTPQGEPLYELRVSVAGLEAPERLGAYRSYIAWATTPLLRPWIKLGEVANGRAAVGRIALDKFLVLVSAEASAGTLERQGPILLRGTSPSMRMIPHEGDPLLFAAAAADPGAHTAHRAAPAAHELEWIEPPPHPGIPMPPGLHDALPSVRPFLPRPPAGSPIPEAVPRRLVRLRNGGTLDLEAAPLRRTIGGRTHVMYGFNGQYPGPLIEVGQGTTILVNFSNRTELPTAIHWHGVRLENRFDGVPHVTQEPVPPGGKFQYRVYFRDAGIYWYHPHHREDIQQDLGLYGNLIVRSPRPDFYAPVNREEVLMLDDLLVAEQGLVPYGLERATHALSGRFGNVLLVNGEPEYRLRVKKGEVVRFFLTNVANTRTFNLSFGGAPIKVVASDLSKFEREEWVENVVLAPAERYVVEVRFDSAGDVAITNRVRGLDHLYGSFFPEVDTLGIVHVSREAVTPDHSAAFARLRDNAEVTADIAAYHGHFDRPVDHTLTLTMRAKELPFPVELMLRLDSAFFNPVEWTGTMPMMDWVATGGEVEWVLREEETVRENMAIEWRFRVGDVVKIRLLNDRRALHAMQHPIHVHGQRFLVLSQNGVANRNLVWKDTMLLPVGHTADLLLELSNPGKWMLHCHIAEHIEAGMKMVFTVE